MVTAIKEVLAGMLFKMFVVFFTTIPDFNLEKAGIKAAENSRR